MEKLEGIGVKPLAIQADVRNEKDIKNLISKTVDEYRRLDILINDAGISHKKTLGRNHFGEI